MVHNVPDHDEQDVIDALGLGPDEDDDGTPDRPGAPGDVGMMTTSGCTVHAVLVGKSQVQMYIDAGDSVATNPEGDIGVKFRAEGTCADELAAGLDAIGD